MDRNTLSAISAAVVALVATREGGVDRNRHQQHGVAQVIGSPPARVAWIETLSDTPKAPKNPVATREGGVDRNQYVNYVLYGLLGRHPRGWRG